MNTANKLYETFTKSTDIKVILNTANEINQHFKKVSDKEPCDEIGEEFVYIIGAKNETFEWILLLLILFVKDDKGGEYLKTIRGKINELSDKQCEWANIILNEIRTNIGNDYHNSINELIEDINKIKETKVNNELEESNISSGNKNANIAKKKSLWKLLFGQKANSTRKTSKNINYSDILINEKCSICNKSIRLSDSSKMTPRQLAGMQIDKSDSKVAALVSFAVSVIVFNNPPNSANEPMWWICKKCQSTRLTRGNYSQNINQMKMTKQSLEKNSGG